MKPGAGARAETETYRPGRRGRSRRSRASTACARRPRSGTPCPGSTEGVPIEVDAFLEDPADVLIRVSEHLDLLVCGSRGYGPLRAVLLGGVTRRVTTAASCPVLVLPRGVELMPAGEGPPEQAAGA